MSDIAILQRNRQFWGRIIGSGFVRSVAVLSSGQLVAMALPILAAPILGRIYPPAEYGVLASYMSVAGVLAAIGNWQYSQGVVVEARDNKAQVLLQLCMITSLLTAVVALGIALAIVLYPTTSEPWQRTRYWFLVLPISTWIAGSTMAWKAMANRRRMYKQMASIQVASVVAAVVSSIGLGLMGFAYRGLLMSYFLSQVVVLVGYLVVMRAPNGRSNRWPVGRKRLLALSRKHRGFALFTTPSEFVNTFVQQLPIYVLGTMGAVEVIGLFSRARQLLSMPLTLLGGSIGQVFQQRAAVDYAKDGTCRRLYIRTFAILMAVAVVPTIVLAMYAPALFEFVLGENWRSAGQVARVLAPMLLLRLVCSPLSTVFSVVGAQREDLILSVATSLLTLVCVMAAWLLDFSANSIVVTFAVGYSVTYFVYLVRGNMLSQCSRS